MPSQRPVSKPTPQARRAKAEYARIPQKTKADDPSRYTKVPHDYGDILIKGGKLGGPLMRDILYWIERHTWGDPKRPEFAKLSLTQLARYCQSWDGEKSRFRNAERKSIAVALAYMERHGIVEARERKGCSANTAKMYKLTPEKWKAAPPYTPPTLAQIAEDEKQAEQEPEDVPADQDQQQGSEMTIASGKCSRPQSITVRPSRNAEPVTIRLVYNPKGFDCPLTVRSTPAANGRIVLNFSPQISEDKANRCSRPQPHFTKQSNDSKRFTEFDTAITAICRRVWNEVPEDELVKRIARAAGAAPVNLFVSIANRKLSGRTAQTDHVPGLLVNLAAQAARSWAKASAQDAQERTARLSSPEPPRKSVEDLERLVREADELDAAEARKRVKR